MLLSGVARMWHERSKMGPFWPLFCVLAPLVSGHHIVEKIVVCVGVTLGAARVFMPELLAEEMEAGAMPSDRFPAFWEWMGRLDKLGDQLSDC